MSEPSRPVVLSIERGHGGYWVAVVSVYPGERMSVTLCGMDLTPERAGELALFTALNIHLSEGPWRKPLTP